MILGHFLLYSYISKIEKSWEKGQNHQESPADRTARRQFVGFDTTNTSQYLASLTGNRRFWPVEVKRIDIKALNLNVGQLWAEASLREATAERIVLDEKLWPAAAKEQAKREVMKPFVEPLAEAIGDREGYIFAADLWELLVGGLLTTAYQKGHVDKRLKRRKDGTLAIFVCRRPILEELL